MRIYILLFLLTSLVFQSQAQTPSDSIDDAPQVASPPQAMPEFPGGDAAFAAFTNKNLVYPKDALKNSIEGVVFVQFTVQTDGAVTDIKIVKGLYPSCDQAVVDLMLKSPKWKPGTNGLSGMPEKIRMVKRIQFVLP